MFSIEEEKPLCSLICSLCHWFYWKGILAVKENSETKFKWNKTATSVFCMMRVKGV